MNFSFLEKNFVLAFHLLLFYKITLISFIKRKILLTKVLSAAIYYSNFSWTRFALSFNLMIVLIKPVA